MESIIKSPLFFLLVITGVFGALPLVTLQYFNTVGWSEPSIITHPGPLWRNWWGDVIVLCSVTMWLLLPVISLIVGISQTIRKKNFFFLAVSIFLASLQFFLGFILVFVSLGIAN